MKRKSTFLAVILIAILGLMPLAAQITLTGIVSDENQQPLIGVSIFVQETLQGTITDENGSYSISMPEDEDLTLTFSYIGYSPQSIPRGDRTEINVIMQQDLAQLDELVFVGYGTQRKGDLTGSVSILDGEELERSVSTSLTDRLQGRVPGVSVTTSGTPGAVGSIKIRGTSFFGDNNPLFVIDGVLTDDSPNLNPNDIESVQILKDASASAIYGSRAANGVVVITTKSGKMGKTEVSVNANIGMQSIPGRIDVTNAEEFARITNAAHDNRGFPRMTKADVDFDPNVDTDWQEVMFNDQALMQDINVSLSSGGEKYTSYISLNNTVTDGTINGTEFERIGGRVNTSFKPWKRLTIGQNMTLSSARSSGLNIQHDLTVIPNILRNLPIIPVYDTTKPSGYGYGELGVATSYVPNPVGMQDLMTNKNQNNRILGNIYVDLEIFKGLKYRFSAGINANFENGKVYNPPFQIRLGTEVESFLSESRGESTEVFIENRLTFNRSFGDHQISAMVTHTEQEVNGSFINSFVTNGHQTEPYYWVLNASSEPTQSLGYEYSSAIRSYLGRFTYNYKDRYLLTAIVRRDGSSKFAPENRWGTFPSVSGGWNIAKEDFFNVDAISGLKLRAGYGVVGNSSIDNYVYQSLVQSSATDGVNYNIGVNGALAVGATRGSLANRNISWETLEETNIGVDLILFKGQIELNADYYLGDLTGLLVDVPVPSTVGPTEGTGTTVTINAVDMKRDGWEANLTYKRVIGDLSFRAGVNAFHTNNKITYLPFGVDEFPGEYSTSRLDIPLGQLFLVEYLGIYTSQEQIDEEGITINGRVPEVGDARYRDVDGRDENGDLTGEPDGNVSFDDDRQIWGNPIPYLQYGFNFSAEWKGFDVYLFIQGISKRDVYNRYYFDLNRRADRNYTADFDPYIDGEGTDPRPYFGDVPNNFESTRFVENGAYLRLKNLQIGYTVPIKQVSNMRIYLSAQNLLTFTKYRGLDPEFEGGVFDPGIDPMQYPQVRTLSAGLSLTL
jgi:TonB-linked SusC/RagA family outer membrane protein